MTVLASDSVTQSANGTSDSIFVPGIGRHMLAVTCSSWSSSAAALEVSHNGIDWAEMRVGDGAARAQISVTQNDIFEVIGNAYYRMVVSSYNAAITMESRVSSHNAR